MENRKLKLEVDEMSNRIEHLKKTIIQQFEKPQDNDQDNALLASMYTANNDEEIHNSDQNSVDGKNANRLTDLEGTTTADGQTHSPSE